MSILSASRYSQISQAIAVLKAQLDEQSNQELNKFEMISIKLKIIQQQAQQFTKILQKEQKQTSAKIDNFAHQTKVSIKQIMESYPKNNELNELQAQLRELVAAKEKLMRSHQRASSAVAEKLQRQIDEAQHKFNEQAEENKKLLKELQDQLKNQIQITKQRLKSNNEHIQDSQTFQHLKRISQSISKEIAELRTKRVERKQNFLSLLEAIVVKCKQNHKEDD